MAKPSRRPRVCRLLTLPPEVRDHIYEQVFSTTGVIHPNVDRLFRIASMHERYGDRFNIIPPAKVLALALTCRQIHNEALRFYYGRNTFSFRDTYDLYRYLYMIGEERRHCIKSIEVLWRGEQRREAAQLIGECINLQRLYIGVNGATTVHTKHPQDNLWVSRGIGQLRKIRGLSNLDLRVREVLHWGRGWHGPLFEISIKEASKYSMTLGRLSHHGKFDTDHIEEFEKGLKEEIGRAGSRMEREVEHNMIESEAGQTVVPGRKKRTSKGRVLRTRKIGVQQERAKRTRKLHVRKARKAGESKRRAPRPRFR